MISRHEEKYLIDYGTYLRIRARAAAAMHADPNAGPEGYVVTSLYFDDPKLKALYEKEDGLAVHTKFRIRTYNLDGGKIRLERKIKRGQITEKLSALIDHGQLAALCRAPIELRGLPEDVFALASEMKSKALLPALGVRYRREAFVLPGTDVRLTFDRRVEALPPDPEALFRENCTAAPALHPLRVIMEVKYTNRCPVLLRRICGPDETKLSVSKYALCAYAGRTPAGLTGLL